MRRSQHVSEKLKHARQHICWLAFPFPSFRDSFLIPFLEMSIRRSPRIAHLTAASEQRQAAMAAKQAKRLVPAAAPAAPAVQEPHIKTMQFTSYWRDKMYDEEVVEGWYFTNTITMSDGSKRTSTFWFNNIYMSDERIVFSIGDHITVHDGCVCLVRPSCFRDTEYIPFAPHITMAQIRGAFLACLRQGPYSYEFPHDVPAGMYSWDYQTPTFVLGF
jgi:hypothetical protein